MASRIGDSFTIENLQSILEAMDKISPIDRSLYFDNYMNEVTERLNVAIRASLQKSLPNGDSGMLSDYISSLQASKQPTR
jgi:hypothetical protein